MLSSVDILYVAAHSLHVEWRTLSSSHPVVGHSVAGVSHHHMVWMPRDQHGLRVDRRRELSHLSVRGRRGAVHVRSVHPLHPEHIVALAGV